MLTANDATTSGHSYDDRAGESYEFPASYRNMVTPGQQFVYYRGRTTTTSSRQPQVYLGTGIVGQVHPAGERLRCDILDYRDFTQPLPFRRPDESYYEPAPDRSGYYWVRGVRVIAQDVYEEIARAGGQLALPAGGLAQGELPPGWPAAQHSRNPEELRKVEEYAVRIALALALARHPGEAVVEQPRSNPGFDILAGAHLHYYEVKGTRQAAPAFFLTEGERLFSQAHPDSYTLICVYDIDLERQSHKVKLHHGELDADAGLLRPVQWTARLSPDAPLAGSD